MTTNMNRGMPHDHDLERRVLAVALHFEEHRALLSDSLIGSDFYTRANAEVFHAVRALHRSADQNFDLLTFASANGESAAVQEFLERDHVDVMSVEAYEGALERLKQLGEARFLGRVALEVGAAVLDGEAKADPSGFLGQAAERLTTALNSRRSNVQVETIGEALQPFLRALADNKPVSPRVVAPSGLEPIDKALPRGGFASGDLTILAARPGMGKTSLAIQIARHSADYGLRPAFFSYEMPTQDLALNVLGQVARMPVAAFSRELSEFEAARAMKCASQIDGMPFVVIDAPKLCFEDFAITCRTLRRKNLLDVVLIDYLQLMRMRADYRSRFEEVTEISTGLKRLARELDVPIIALAQLNREVEKRADKRPVMSDLAQSGQIECDADNIIFLYRECIYNASADPRACEVIFAKNRKGRIGALPMRFDAVTTTFSVAS